MPAPANTVFNVASVTKTVTAMVTLCLFNSGKWDLDEPTFPQTENGQLQSFTYKFMQIWQKKDSVWRVTREMTYGYQQGSAV